MTETRTTEAEPGQGRGSRNIAATCGIVIAAFLGLLAVAGVLLFLFVAPRMASGADVLSGSQPGGKLTGRVGPPQALRELTSVQLYRGELSPGGAHSLSSLATIPLAADGSFEFDAPPLEGFYVVEAGEGMWRKQSRSATFLLEDGTSVSSVVVDLELERGCEVIVRVKRRDPAAPLDGTLDYRVRYTNTGLFGSGSGSGTRPIRSGEGVIDGLPAAAGELTILMEDGAAHTTTFSVESGRIVIGVEL